MEIERKYSFQQTEFSNNEIILGCNLKALIYSFLYNIPMIYHKDFQNVPFELDFFDFESDYGKKVLSLLPFLLPFKEGNILRKKDIYEKLFFILSISGLIPFTNNITNIDIVENNDVKIVVSDKYVIDISCKKFIVFDYRGIKDLSEDIIKKVDQNITYLVADWFDVLNPTVKQLNNLQLINSVFYQSQHSFINKIFVHKENSSEEKMKIVSISLFTKKQFETNDESMSETVVLIKTRKIVDMELKHIRRNWHLS